MKKRIHLAFIATMLAISTSSYAGTAALGFELGVSTAEQVKADLTKFTNLEEPDVSGLTGGVYLKTDNAGYGIDGLNTVTYIFDKNNVLGAILINMTKSRFNAIYDAVSRKYKLETAQRPFVGDQFARFKASDAVIEIDAPHLSFEMDVSYIRNDIKAMSLKQAAENKRKKKKRDEESF